MKDNETAEEVKERVVSPREKMEQEQIDNELRGLINELLNSRMEDPQATEELITELEKKWFTFCIKPRRVGLMSSVWKKIRPSNKAFRVQANHFVEMFDKAQQEQLEEAPIVEDKLNYKFK